MRKVGLKQRQSGVKLAALTRTTLSLLLILFTGTTCSLTPMNPRVLRRSRSNKINAFSYVELRLCIDNSEEGSGDMENLIVSLSLDPTDESRRERVALLFAEELAKTNDSSKVFSDLFGSTLSLIGERVQEGAKEQAMEKQKKKQEETDVAEDSEKIPGKPEKSPEENQLWALVDMMVQSKTLVKKASGDLGSKGTLQ